MSCPLHDLKNDIWCTCEKVPAVGRPTAAPPTRADLAAFVAVVTASFKAKFGDRAAIVVAAGMPDRGNHDAFAYNWAGPCLTAKGLIHYAIPELDKTIVFPESLWKPG